MCVSASPMIKRSNFGGKIIEVITRLWTIPGRDSQGHKYLYDNSVKYNYVYIVLVISDINMYLWCLGKRI